MITVRTIKDGPLWTWAILDGEAVLSSGQAESNAIAAYAAGIATHDLIKEAKLRVGMFEIKTDPGWVKVCILRIVFDVPF